MPGNGPGCATPSDPTTVTNPENCQDKSTFLVAWGVETNVYAHVGGSEEGDIYYTRTNDKGATYTSPSVVEGLGNSNRFESQLRSTPAGNIVFTVWNESNNDVGGAYSGLSTSISTDGSVVAPPVTPDPVEPVLTQASDKGILGGFDNVSLFAMIFGFVAIALFIARKRLPSAK